MTSQATECKWHESEFEEWFIDNPCLPADGNGQTTEQLLLIRQEGALERVVDLLALDREGGLVFIEVKNEKSTRTVIGQAFEYLAQYEKATIEDLEGEWREYTRGTKSTLQDAFRHKHGCDFTQLSPRRRVVIVAPSFDVPTAVCVDFLSGQLRDKKIELQLIKAGATHGGGFQLDPVHAPPFKHPRDLGQRFARTARGRLFYVLHGGPRPIGWNVGLLENDGEIRLPSTVLKRGIRPLNRPLIPLPSPPPNCDCTLLGTNWGKRTDRTSLAKVIGRVSRGPADLDKSSFVVIARFGPDGFRFFQKKSWAEFQEVWSRTDGALPDWDEIVRSAEAKR